MKPLSWKHDCVNRTERVLGYPTEHFNCYAVSAEIWAYSALASNRSDSGEPFPKFFPHAVASRLGRKAKPSASRWLLATSFA